jgi:hypothetical protein
MWIRASSASALISARSRASATEWAFLGGPDVGDPESVCGGGVGVGDVPVAQSTPVSGALRGGQVLLAAGDVADRAELLTADLGAEPVEVSAVDPAIRSAVITRTNIRRKSPALPTHAPAAVRTKRRAQPILMPGSTAGPRLWLHRSRWWSRHRQLTTGAVATVELVNGVSSARSRPSHTHSSVGSFDCLTRGMHVPYQRSPG